MLTPPGPEICPFGPVPGTAGFLRPGEVLGAGHMGAIPGVQLHNRSPVRLAPRKAWEGCGPGKPPALQQLADGIVNSGLAPATPGTAITMRSAPWTGL